MTDDQSPREPVNGTATASGTDAGGAQRRPRRRRRRPTPRPTGQQATAATAPAAPAAKRKKRPASGQQSPKRKPAGRGRSPIRVQSRKTQPSEFGTHWWARRWLAALEKFGWLARLERGRDYARRGNVLDLDISPGKISAQVQGSRPWPYHVEIGLQPLTDEQWERVVRRLGRQALYAAKLLAGDMPQNIENIFNAADIALIPRKPDAFTMSCTCPDPVAPCKHIAAVHYVLGQEFDRDPFVLFELRGRTRQDIVKALQGRPQSEVINSLPLVPAVALDDHHSLENFWKSPSSLAEFSVHIEPAAVPGGLLKRLGPLPLRGQSDEWRTQLFDVYRLVSRRAFALGRGDDREPMPAPTIDAVTEDAASPSE
jgi:uncharacterized Zn finger protein